MFYPFAGNEMTKLTEGMFYYQNNERRNGSGAKKIDMAPLWRYNDCVTNSIQPTAKGVYPCHIVIIHHPAA